jgi:hypothetical protein
VAGRLFIPGDALLHPPMSDDEIRALCPAPVSFLHPTLGLSAYEEESRLGIEDFIERPAERGDCWNGARAGVEPWPALRGVALANPPALDDVFGGAEQEIGRAPREDLPPMPSEPKDGAFAQAGRTLRAWLARGVRALTELAPKTASSRTWLNDLADWAGRQLQGVSEQLDRIRNKELHRLLHLLKTDPEAGLRHAISMGHLPHRGMAPPGDRLRSRHPDFNLSRLRGGGPADCWQITEDWQEILRNKYRELAEREMRLGRFRRAAYIYAELLGDFLAAANVLKQGRHFREAALLYEQHLHNPLEAAACLAEGGLFAEAIERYEKLGHWLEAAELHLKLGDDAAAVVLIRRAVDERLAADDPLGAARLVEERLHDVDGALALLFAAWPASAQAASCLTMGFQLLGRLGRSAPALEQLARLRRESVPDHAAAALVTGLVNAARNFPDATFRAQAADFSRVMIARQLGRANLEAGRASAFADLLMRLAPQDRLLVRDVQRHLRARHAAVQRTRKPAPPPVPGRLPVIVNTIDLPRKTEWLQLRAEWHSFFAAGLDAKHLVVLRGSWEGSYQRVSWPCPTHLAREGLFLEPTGDHGREVAVAVPGAPPLPTKLFPVGDEYFGQSCSVGTPNWMSPANLYSWGDEVRWSVHVAAGRAVLTCYGTDDALRRSVDITRELLAGAVRTDDSRLLLRGLPYGAAVALGNRLVVVSGDAAPEAFELPRQATGLVRSLPHTRKAIVVLLEHGAVLRWIGLPELVELDRDIAAPVGAFLPGGPLVLLSPAQRALLLLEVDATGVKQVTRFPLTGQAPVAVCATATLGQFAVLDRNGSLVVYRLGS